MFVSAAKNCVMEQGADGMSWELYLGPDLINPNPNPSTTTSGAGDLTHHHLTPPFVPIRFTSPLTYRYFIYKFGNDHDLNIAYARHHA